MLLGCIADDFTGATDLASMLVKGGMRTIQAIGVPAGPPPDDVDAVVVALKSRTIPAQEAVAQSLAALAWLRAHGAPQVYFKYCSTFDSTPQGNIGPVTDALMDALGTGFTIACPAFPENGRTIFRGYLFVGDVLLSESGMKDHPLTPMTDASLVRVLQAQTRRRVGLVRFDTVAAGPQAIRERFAALAAEGTAMAIVDAVSDADLGAIGAACEDMPLVTAGSGVGLGLALNARARGRLAHAATASALPRVSGSGAVVSGSCSVATNAQVEEWRRSRPAFRVDALELAAGAPVVRRALDWAGAQLARAPVLVYATSTPAEVRAVQARLGTAAAGALIEGALSQIAQGLVALGVRKLVVAGGETSGAVVQALGVQTLRIGPQIDPGVPWTLADGATPVALALKSGNFGSVDFFAKALEQLA
ncbi:MAG: four-carbon acid sugar kinase family protein [Burkholderiales bacterium]|nr:four-carbon acid sugar kinase family protein [Burkholderiales bacterium]